MSLKSKLKQKGALSEYKCDICDNPICECIIERIRKQEDALVVAKQALESVETLNTKLTMDIEDLRKENAELKEKAQNTFWNKVSSAKGSIDKQYQRFANRSKLIQ